MGRAITLGRIRLLYQPVAGFITEWRTDPVRSRILIHHLLEGTAVFLPQGYSVQADDVLNLAFLHPRHEGIIVSDYPIVSEPGAEFSYNNAQFDLIALLIQRATGRRYHELVGKELLRPIGAASARRRRRPRADFLTYFPAAIDALQLPEAIVQGEARQSSSRAAVPDGVA